MCAILKLTCAAADCKSPGIDGDEECHFGDAPRNRMECDHGHQMLYYGRGLIEDLHIKARAAGWHCDGKIGQWFCPDHAKTAIACSEWCDKFLSATNEDDTAEAVAHSMNV